MQYREDLMFSAKKSSIGLLTLGEFRTITVNGRQIELYPFLREADTRGLSIHDPRRRLNTYRAIPILAQAYADHFNNAGLDEHWTTEEVVTMLQWQAQKNNGDYFLVKWAKDISTGEEFPIGFFCAYSKPFQGGDMIWDGELFVLPDFRQFGIGTELFEAMLIVAKKHGINMIEALTYQDESGYPLKFMENIGLDSSDLIHIYGDIDHMLSTINEKRQVLK